MERLDAAPALRTIVAEKWDGPTHVRPVPGCPFLLMLHRVRCRFSFAGDRLRLLTPSEASPWFVTGRRPRTEVYERVPFQGWSVKNSSGAKRRKRATADEELDGSPREAYPINLSTLFLMLVTAGAVQGERASGWQRRPAETRQSG